MNRPGLRARKIQQASIGPGPKSAPGLPSRRVLTTRCPPPQRGGRQPSISRSTCAARGQNEDHEQRPRSAGTLLQSRGVSAFSTVEAVNLDPVLLCTAVTVIASSVMTLPRTLAELEQVAKKRREPRAGSRPRPPIRCVLCKDLLVFPQSVGALISPFRYAPFPTPLSGLARIRPRGFYFPPRLLSDGSVQASSNRRLPRDRARRLAVPVESEEHPDHERDGKRRCRPLVTERDAPTSEARDRAAAPMPSTPNESADQRQRHGFDP